MKYWAEAVAVSKGMNVDVTEPDASPLAIQGPKAVEVVSDIMGDWVRDLKYFGFKHEIQGIL